MTLAPDVPDRPARILIVDDERHNSTLLQVMLAPQGYHVRVASSGEQALDMVAAEPPDLILLDIMMPGLNGYEVAARIKGNAPTKNIPVIMVSALDDREARMLGLNAGAEDFLTKPVDRAELSVRVRNLLRLKAYGDYYGKYSEMLEGEVASRTADLVERTKTLDLHATALRRSEESTNFALASARMGIWEIDVATQRLTWSTTMAPLYGMRPDEAPTDTEAVFRLIHPDDRQMVRDAGARAMRDHASYDIEYRVQCPDGATRWIAGRASMVLDAENNPVRLLGVSTDISEQKLLETQLRQAQKMEAVGQLAGGVAHDFNNLLTAILLNSNFVIETLRPNDERRADMEEVIKAGERAAALTTQLLAFSRKQILQPTAVDLNALVGGMQHMLGRLIGEQVDLVPVLAADLCVVRADRGQLEQVLMNLVVNARDAMPSGGRLAVETANVELDDAFLQDTVVRPGSYVMLAVTDTGVGMDDSTRRHLFEPFFTTKETGKGTGLGLATTYGIVKQSGGHIWVHSEPGHGSTFKVYLPCAGSEDRDHPVERTTERELEVASGTETVLVVEDEAPVRSLMRRILERAGYHVFDAADPRQAEILFEQQIDRVSLLVTDVIMPGSSGPSLFERLLRRRPDLKVLYVSGYTDETIVHHGRLAPGVEFLQKPFTAAGLSRRVRKVLDAGRPTASMAHAGR